VATTVWKGHLTFGLVSIPVKLYRAARAEKISFRQLHGATGARVRQKLVAEAPPEPEYDVQPEPESEPEPVRQAANGPVIVPPPNRPRIEPEPAPPPPLEREVSRSEITKGYEYEKGRYAMISKEELSQLQPKTSREMEIVEFVKLEEVDPVYFETSYYVVPEASGERPYALLFEALRKSGLVAVAQVAMHNREHVVVIRSGKRGIILHTMFYESEIRKSDEYPAEAGNVSQKELELALMLVRNLEAPFEPAKYRDTYREKVDALINSKISGEQVVEAPAPAKRAQVEDLMEVLRRSLEKTAPARKPPVPAEPEPAAAAPATRARRSKSRGGA
jgi:DNA end-binding protein Ku